MNYNLVNYSIGGNEPYNKKKAYKKYTKSKDKFKVSVSYNNTVYYLDTFETTEEAIKTYDHFQKDPITFINKLNRIYNTNGVNMYQEGKLINSFNSITICAKYLNTESTHISACCRGKRKAHKGYTFQYR